MIGKLINVRNTGIFSKQKGLDFRIELYKFVIFTSLILHDGYQVKTVYWKMTVVRLILRDENRYYYRETTPDT